MKRKKNNINYTEYQQSLFNKYEVDESYLQTRKQRRACLDLLEKVDKDKNFNEKKLIKKVVGAFKGTELYKTVASCMTIGALMMTLQTTPVMAEAVSNFTPNKEVIKIAQQAQKDAKVILDKDSVLNKKVVIKNPQAKNTSIHLVVDKKERYEPLAENGVVMDEDSDINYNQNKKIKALTVIDTSIEDWEVLRDSVKEGEILLLDGRENPLDAIINKLEETKEVDRLNIISHGSSGKLHFENRVIGSKDLEENKEKWKKIGSILNRDGDLQLFGCNVAKGEEGKSFIKSLSNMTGADVAASINPTGSKDKGGDWKLEVQQGKVESDGSIDREVIKDFLNLLLPSGEQTYHLYNDFTDQGNTFTHKYFNVSATVNGSEANINKNTSTDNKSAFVYAEGMNSDFTIKVEAKGDGFESFELEDINFGKYIFNGYYVIKNFEVIGHKLDGSTISSGQLYVKSNPIITGEDFESGWNNFDGEQIDYFTVKGQTYDWMMMNSLYFYDFTVSNMASPNTPPEFDDLDKTISINVDENASAKDIKAQLAATDSDGDSLTWSQNNAPSKGVFNVSGTANGSGSQVPTIATFIPNANSIGSDSFTVDVNDGTESDTLTVNVNINDVDPVINDKTVSIDENATNGTSVTTVSATDDTDGLIYSITGGNTENAFIIDSSTGEITVNDGDKLDYETKASYSLTVAVDDEDGDTTSDDTATITINLNDVFEPDSDGTVTQGTEVDESQAIDIPTTADTIEKAVDIFDFILTDGATSDGVDLTVTSLDINVSGTDASKLTYVLANPNGGGDLSSDVIGNYNSGKVTFDLSGNNIVVSDGTNEAYVIKAYFNDNTDITDNASITISIDGDTDITVDGNGTQMLISQDAVTNGGNTNMSVSATALSFKTQPAGSISGSQLTTQPIVKAVDAFGNIDKDFTETVILTKNGDGTLSGDVDVNAVDGIATFTDIVYKAAVDGESFTLIANDQDDIDTDLPTVDANTLTSDVVATKLVFSTEPSPTGIMIGQVHDFTTDPIVKAVDEDGIVDKDFTETVTISENGSGTSVFENNTKVAIDGVANFSGLTINHDTEETFNLQANDEDGVDTNLPLATSTNITAADNEAPTLGGTFTTNGTVDDNKTITPFSGVMVSDNNGDNVSIRITYTGENGTLSSPTGGLTENTAGDYTLDLDTAENIISKLQALVFTPTANQVEVGNSIETTFTLKPNDGTSEGSLDNTTKITATSINDAPTIAQVSPRLKGICRYDTDNEGQYISNIVLASIEDADINAIEGIAITNMDEGNGTWQYSIDNGDNWTDINSVSEDSALLLSADDKVRFVPKNVDESTTATITYKAWDRTNGSIGDRIDASIDGDTTAFSNKTDTASIEVEAFNDPYIDITFSEPIYGKEDGTGAISKEDLNIIFNQNSGNATNVEILSVKKVDNTSEDSASSLTGGETRIRVFLKITGRPHGLETIEIKPVSDSIYDKVGNPMGSEQTTGEKQLSGKGGIS